MSCLLTFASTGVSLRGSNLAFFLPREIAEIGDVPIGLSKVWGRRTCQDRLSPCLFTPEPLSFPGLKSILWY